MDMFMNKAIKELISFIKSHNLEVTITADNDIYIPQKKIVISYCDFSEYCKKVDDKNRLYNLNKLRNNLAAGTNTIIIFEDEYKFHKDIVIARLKHILHVSKAKKIYARTCAIREIETGLSREFCNKFHIQQSGQGAKVKLGAFKNKGFLDSDLVAVLTVGKLSRAKGNKIIPENSWELIRFCSDSKYMVTGIASKLYKYFERNYKWETVISFADRRWSLEGNLYKQLGFELEKETQPNYYYIKPPDIHRTHRFAYRRDSLRDRARKETDLSEDKIQIMSELDLAQFFGARRVFDCGNYKFVKNNKQE
jgi:hypothetical protein